MTNAEILNALHEFYFYRTESKAKLKAMRVELMRIAVELGQPQEDAIQGSSKDFLDGYLVALGYIPFARSVTTKDAT